MATAPYLFEMEPFKVRRAMRFRRTSAPLPSGVRNALDHLKQVLDALPPEEIERRRQRYERVCGITGPRLPRSS